MVWFLSSSRRQIIHKKRLTTASRPCFRPRATFLIAMMLTILTIWLGSVIRFILASKQAKENAIPLDPLAKDIMPSDNSNADGIAREIAGLEILIRIPSNDGHPSDLEVVLPLNVPTYFSSDMKYSKPRGVVLLLHACTHSAFKFFSPSNASCPNCVGLSEELRIVRLVLEQGYIPVALSSVDRKSGCWNPGKDAARIKYLIQWLKQGDDQMSTTSAQVSSHRKFVATALSSTTSSRVYAIGASSGGAMSAHLVAHDIAEAGLVMVMGLGPRLISQLNELHDQQERETGGNRAKLYLAPMPRDKGTTQKAMQNYQTLCADCPTFNAEKDQRLSEPDWVVLDTTRCSSLPLTVKYLVQRVPGINVEAATLLINALQEANHMDKATQQLIVDPTRSNWRDLLLQKEGKTTSNSNNAYYYHGKFALKPGYSPLAKALHRAWAFHEYCSEVVIPALEFFEKK